MLTNIESFQIASPIKEPIKDQVKRRFSLQAANDMLVLDSYRVGSSEQLNRPYKANQQHIYRRYITVGHRSISEQLAYLTSHLTTVCHSVLACKD